ncbi:MAG TPA: amidohydrolase family protein [Armatimonadota bacterium]|nr:amidohydrolase family protein [Armatimonadota bacterium]
MVVALDGIRVVDGGRSVKRSLYFAEGRIVDSESAELRLDLRGHLVSPALINSHDHLHLNSIPRLRHRSPFPNSYAWMDAFQPFFKQPEVMAALAVPVDVRLWHGGLKNVLSGVTTVAHHDPLHPVLAAPDFPVRVLRDYGWSHSLGLGTKDKSRSSLQYGPPVMESCRATPPAMPWFIHLAEGIDDVAAIEIDELDDIGCLGPNTVLIHGVCLTNADLNRVIRRGAGVVWCPHSNQRLFGRTLAPRRLQGAGRLALGTDSRLTGSSDLLEELKTAAALSDLSPPQLFELVTSAGARLLRMPEVGGMAPGMHADLMILRDTGRDPGDELLTLTRSEIRAVVKDGVPVIADPDFEPWFAACHVETARVRLDGIPKLIAASALGRRGAAGLEPGLEPENSHG